MFESTGAVIERILRENEALRLEVATLRLEVADLKAARAPALAAAEARVAELDRLLREAGEKLDAQKVSRSW